MDIVESRPSFLRSIYHTLNASQAPKWGHAPQKVPMPNTALVFLFHCYRPAFICCGTEWLCMRYATSDFCRSLADAILFRLYRLRVSVLQNPAQSPVPFYQPLSRVLDYVAYVCCLLYCQRCLFIIFV